MCSVWSLFYFSVLIGLSSFAIMRWRKRPHANCYIRKPKDISFLALEKKIYNDFTIYGHGGKLGFLLGPFDQTFILHSIRNIHMKFEFNWASYVRGEDV